VRGGSLRSIADALEGRLSEGARHVVLDNTYLTRASRSHVLDILNVLDPFRESANANRVRAALAVGYPKFVRFKLHDGTVDAKIELGGIAQLVRIGEIKAVPLGPLLQRYVAPTVTQLLPPRPERKPVMTGPTASSGGAGAGKSATRDP